MGRNDDGRGRPGDPDGPDRRARRRFRICLAASIPAYLVGAAAAAWWLPGQPFVAYVLAFFAAHSAAYLLNHLVRGDDEDQIP